MKRSPPDPEARLAAALVRFPPPIAALALRARALVRSQLATATEEITSTPRQLVLGYCVTAYKTDGVVAVLVTEGSVVLSFRQLRPIAQAEGLLQLSPDASAQIIVMDEPLLGSLLTVKAILRAAATQARPRLPTRGGGRTVVAVRPV